MLTSYSSSYKTWVFAKNGVIPDMPIGRLLDFVINPETGIFEGIWIRTTKRLGILALRDILSWDSEGLFVSQESDIVDPDNLPRISKVIDKELPILGAKVIRHETDECIGTVSDFSFDTISPRILSINVFSGFWIFGKRRIINRKYILKIAKRAIFIRDPKVEVAELKRIKRLLEKKLESGIDSTSKSTKK
jgi:sporulation protein YlmC with PRC-barrel domain